MSHDDVLSSVSGWSPFAAPPQRLAASLVPVAVSLRVIVVHDLFYVGLAIVSDQVNDRGYREESPARTCMTITPVSAVSAHFLRLHRKAAATPWLVLRGCARVPTPQGSRMRHQPATPSWPSTKSITVTVATWRCLAAGDLSTVIVGSSGAISCGVGVVLGVPLRCWGFDLVLASTEESSHTTYKA